MSSTDDVLGNGRPDGAHPNTMLDTGASPLAAGTISVAIRALVKRTGRA